MMESAVLSVGAAYLFQFAAGRERPYQTTDLNRRRAGRGSFPSVHATAAFAIGSVLAEAGNYRWIRPADQGVPTATSLPHSACIKRPFRNH
jgi:membrane-associated phospholipid phosphatase